MQVGSIEIDLIANIGEYQKSINESTKLAAEAAESIKKSFENVAEALLLEKALDGVKEGFEKLVEVSEESQKQMALVNQAITSTGGAAGVTSDAVVELADKMRELTGANQEATVGAEALLLRFTNLHSDNFPKATKAVEDLSAGMGMDLSSAALKVGRAMEDPVKGLSLLQRAGVSVSAELKNTVAQLVAAGDTAGAQTVILDALSKAYGGAAAAARDTLGGAFKALQSDTEELIATFGGTDGLRKIVEETDTAIEELIETVKEAKDPTTDLGKQTKTATDSISKGFSEAVDEVRVWGDLTIHAFAVTGELVQEFAVMVSAALKSVNDDMRTTYPAFAMLEDGVGAALKKIGDFFNATEKQAHDMVDKGRAPDVLGHMFDPLSKALNDIDKKTKEKLASIKAEAASFAPKDGGGDDGDGTDAKAAKKAQAEIAKEEKAINDVVAAIERKNAALQAAVNGESKFTEYEEALKKVMADTNAPLADRLAAVKKIQDAEAQSVELNKQLTQNKEKAALDGVIQDMEDANALATAKIGKSKEDVAAIEAQHKIWQLLKNDTDVGIAQQERIKRLYQDQAAIQKEQDHQTALKSVDELLQGQEESNRNDQLKLQGLEKMIPLYDEIDKINKDINLTQEDKDAAIKKATDLFNIGQQYNDQLDLQDDALKRIVDSTGKVTDKQQKLYQAWQDGIISGEQYAKGLQDINDKSEKAKDEGGEFGKILGDGLEKIISGTGKASDGFKDMAKQLEMLALKTLVMKPLEQMITNIGNALFGGNSQPANSNGSPGASASSGGIIGSIVNGIGSGATNFIGKLFGGGKASGGMVSPSEYYVVGENGPEIFAPGQSGNIFTNQQSFGGGGFVTSGNGWHLGGGGNTGGTGAAYGGLGDYGGQYATNGNGAYLPNYDPGQTLNEQQQNQLHQIILNANKVRLQQEANSLPSDSPYRNELDQEAQWGYNPTLSSGQAYTSWGGAADDVTPSAMLDTLLADAKLSGSSIPPDLLAAARRVQSNAQNAPLSNYGFSQGPTDAASNFGGGDGGAAYFGQDVVDADWQRQVNQGNADNLFGNGSHVALGDEYTPGGSAFGNYIGGGPNLITTGASVNGTGNGIPGIPSVAYDPGFQVPGGASGGSWGDEEGSTRLPDTLRDIAQDIADDATTGSDTGTPNTRYSDNSLASLLKDITNPLGNPDNQAFRDALGIGSTDINEDMSSLPARKFGGGVEAGEDYQVGENGPEIFRPHSNGTIIPNSGGAPNITINNNHPGVAAGEVSVTGQGNNLVVTIAKAVASSIGNNGTVGNAIRGRYNVQTRTPRRS